MYIATERPSGKDKTACASKTISSGNDQSDVTVSFFVRESGSGKKPLVIIDYEEFVKGFGSGTVSKRVESENFTVQLCLVQTWKGTDPRAIWYSNVRINVQEYIPTTPAPTLAPTELCVSITVHVTGTDAVSTYDGVYNKQSSTINGYDWWVARNDVGATEATSNATIYFSTSHNRWIIEAPDVYWEANTTHHSINRQSTIVQ